MARLPRPRGGGRRRLHGLRVTWQKGGKTGEGLGFWGLGFWGLGFWGLGFRGLGLRGSGFWGLGFRGLGVRGFGVSHRVDKGAPCGGDPCGLQLPNGRVAAQWGPMAFPFAPIRPHWAATRPFGKGKPQGSPLSTL